MDLTILYAVTYFIVPATILLCFLIVYLLIRD